MENKPVVLDCGSGPGSLLGLMEEWFPQTTLYGLDIDHTVISKARRATRGTNYLVASAETLPFPEKAVDILVTLHMVEHLQEPELFFPRSQSGPPAGRHPGSGHPQPPVHWRPDTER